MKKSIHSNKQNKQASKYLPSISPSVIAMLILLFLFTSCGSKEEATVRLTQKERTRVDTLFTREVKLLRPHLDSICDASFDKMVAAAVDSILIVRKEEEKRLRSRLLNPN